MKKHFDKRITEGTMVKIDLEPKRSRIYAKSQKNSNKYDKANKKWFMQLKAAHTLNGGWFKVQSVHPWRTVLQVEIFGGNFHIQDVLSFTNKGATK